MRIETPSLPLSDATPRNLQHCLAAIDDAAQAGIDVLILPPFANCPPPWPAAQVFSIATRVPGPFVEEIQERVRIRRVWVVFGVLERGDAAPEVFDTRLVIAPTGHLAGLRRTAIEIDAAGQPLAASAPPTVVEHAGQCFVLGNGPQQACLEPVTGGVPRVVVYG